MWYYVGTSCTGVGNLFRLEALIPQLIVSVSCHCAKHMHPPPPPPPYFGAEIGSPARELRSSAYTFITQFQGHLTKRPHPVMNSWSARCHHGTFISNCFTVSRNLFKLKNCYFHCMYKSNKKAKVTLLSHQIK